MINSNDVIKIAGLAKLKIKEDQISSFTDQMNQILNFINQLNNLDTSQVEATAHALSSSAPLREDEVQPFTLQDKVFEQAPKQEDNLFVVPKVIG